MANTKADEKQPTRLSEAIAQAMEEKGVSIKDLAVKLDITYEHARRLARGEGPPSKFLLKLICEYLGINYKEAQRMATVDQLQKKYGGIPLELSGKKPGMEPIERVWDVLTPDQQKDAVSMVLWWAKRNKAAKTAHN